MLISKLHQFFSNFWQKKKEIIFFHALALTFTAAGLNLSFVHLSTQIPGGCLRPVVREEKELEEEEGEEAKWKC